MPQAYTSVLPSMPSVSPFASSWLPDGLQNKSAVDAFRRRGSTVGIDQTLPSMVSAAGARSTEKSITASLDADVFVLRRKRGPAREALVVDAKDLGVRHVGDSRTETQMRRPHCGVGVLDDRGVRGPCDANLVGGHGDGRSSAHGPAV